MNISQCFILLQVLLLEAGGDETDLTDVPIVAASLQLGRLSDMILNSMITSSINNFIFIFKRLAKNIVHKPPISNNVYSKDIAKGRLLIIVQGVHYILCFFLKLFCDFSELCQFCCSTVVLPACCVYTHWHRGKTENGIF